ncbi:MAG: Hsp20 family protein [Oligoflexia bacterium]|nr:Hsp20 family protein [Oligoflexia bacterium]
MKVNDSLNTQEKSTNNYLIDSNKKNIAEKKVKDIEKAYQEMAERAKVDGDIKLQRLRDVNRQQLINETNEQADRLTRLSGSLTKVQDRIEEEKNLITLNHESEKDRLSDKSTEDYENLKEKSRDQTESLQSIIKDSMSRLRQDGQETVFRIKSKQMSDESDIATNNKFKLDTTKNEFEEIRRLNDSKYQSTLNKQRFDHETMLSKESSNHERKMHDLLQLQQNEYQNQMQRFKTTIDQANKDFLKKYAEVIENHRKSMDQIKTEALKNIQKYKNKIEKGKDVYVQRSEDPFYHPLTLNPKIEENQKNFVIRLQVPAYEKDSVQVSGKDKNLRITFNRDVKDVVVKDDGTTNKYSKVESYSKHIVLDNTIDPKGIEHKYTDGVLTITVPKG